LKVPTWWPDASRSDALELHVTTVRPVPAPMSDTKGLVIGTRTFSLHHAPRH
jgi:hypothetical protein